MGCDIHFTIEKLMPDATWELINRDNSEQRAKGRSYSRFSNLCGVRGHGTGKEPNGLPDDISRGSQIYVDEWGPDGHSHGWISMMDICKIFYETDIANGDPEGRLEMYLPDELPELYFDLYINSGFNSLYRVIYFFDN